MSFCRPVRVLLTLAVATLGIHLVGLSSVAAGRLILGTTTSTADSGLLEAILPDFEHRFDVDVEVLAVGTGQALEMGRRGDVDVLLVHARTLEDTFVEEGYAAARYDVMFNDFIIVGPLADPLGIKDTLLAADAFLLLSQREEPFASRGDNSGTNIKELQIWTSIDLSPGVQEEWYIALGQGMAATLVYANETGAYALTDRGTFLARSDVLPDLQIVVGGPSIELNKDETLRNSYGVLPLSPERFPWVNADTAAAFVAWLTSAETQEAIAEFGIEKHGQPLFFPDSEAWRAQEESSADE
ncbi:substrate-binding domain-containing protein [Candidatus Bipolaricaulota bacterium]